jgi:hypothetical protein
VLPGQEVTPPCPSACTNACTREQESGPTLTVEALAAALLRLSPEDRTRLVAMLLGQQPEGKAGGNAP